MAITFGRLIPEVALAGECKSSGIYESRAMQVNLLELYSSEGCSSCPPVEKWMNSLYSNSDYIKLLFP
jgi:hypothetical protein